MVKVLSRLWYLNRSGMHGSLSTASRGCCDDPIPITSVAGSSKHTVELESPRATVNDLKSLIEESTEIPPQSQRIIFKGKPATLIIVKLDYNCFPS